MGLQAQFSRNEMIRLLTVRIWASPLELISGYVAASTMCPETASGSINKLGQPTGDLA